MEEEPKIQKDLAASVPESGAELCPLDSSICMSGCIICVVSGNFLAPVKLLFPICNKGQELCFTTCCVMVRRCGFESCTQSQPFNSCSLESLFRVIPLTAGLIHSASEKWPFLFSVLHILFLRDFI